MATRRIRGPEFGVWEAKSIYACRPKCKESGGRRAKKVKELTFAVIRRDCLMNDMASHGNFEPIW